MIKENSYLKIKNYFANLVEQSNFLQEFVGFSEREWNAKRARLSGIKTPTLALFRYQNGFESPELKASAVRQIGFAIMLKVSVPDDFEAQYKAIDDAEKYALKVLSRIQFDCFQPGHMLYNSFNRGSVVINPVELSANDFGVEVFLHLKNPQPLKVEIEDWKDIDKIC